MPQDVHILIPRICECVTLHDKKDFVDVFRDLDKGDYPGCSKWAQCEVTYKNLLSERGMQESESEKEM